MIGPPPRSTLFPHPTLFRSHKNIPSFLHLGRLLRAGEPPFLTLASFISGNLLGEYQFAVLNPVSLALYAVLPSFGSLETAALFLACFHYGVLASGMYVLARSYRVAKAGAVVDRKSVVQGKSVDL